MCFHSLIRDEWRRLSVTGEGYAEKRFRLTPFCFTRKGKELIVQEKNQAYLTVGECDLAGLFARHMTQEFPDVTWQSGDAINPSASFFFCPYFTFLAQLNNIAICLSISIVSSNQIIDLGLNDTAELCLFLKKISISYPSVVCWTYHWIGVYNKHIQWNQLYVRETLSPKHWQLFW